MKPKKHFPRTKAAPIAITFFSMLCGIHAAELNIVADIPTEDLLLSRGDGLPLGGAGIQQTFGFRNADMAGTEGTRSRGQSFVIEGNPGSDYAISSLTVSLSNSGDDAGYRPDGQLALTVFEFAGADPDDFTQWQAGTGGMSGPQIFAGTFPITSGTTLPASDFIKIDFAEGELNLADGKPYGFLFLYTLDELVDAGGVPLDEDVTIAFDADLNAPDATVGALLSTNPAPAFEDAPNGVSATRDLNYFITGTAQELGFRITEFSYDPGSDMVTLEWPSSPTETFAVRYSTDMTTWVNDLDDTIPADEGSESTERTYDLEDFNIHMEGDLFFRVEKVTLNP